MGLPPQDLPRDICADRAWWLATARAVMNPFFLRIGETWSVPAFLLGWLCLLLAVPAANAQTTETFNSSTTWTAPAGVTAVIVEAWGGGGGGHRGSSSGNYGGGGGGGGAYANSVVAVTAGSNYTITVGAGGSSGSPGTNGGATSFNGSTVVAAGGTGGGATTGGGAGGTTAASTGATVYAGCNGGSGVSDTTGSGEAGGGGGGSPTAAGTCTAGGNGSGITTGGAAGTGQGAGGDGAAGTSNATAGGTPGGGGGGGSESSSSDGAAGGAGRVVLTYTAGGGGGTCTSGTVGIDTVVTCTASGSITIPAGVTSIRYLLVGGGGGGGGVGTGNEDGAGGGGAGGVLHNNTFTVTPGTFNVVVGSGGTAGTGAADGGNGGNSTFSTLTAIGGGGGAREGGNNGVTGGSGGGGSGNGSGAAGTAGQGNAGGNGNNGDGGGGGGGAGASGASADNSGVGANGGAGYTDDISGASTTYGGGGGGGANQGLAGGSGGSGGGGSAPTGRGAGTAGTANMGGGGGGASGSSSGSAYSGGAGGSGIVIIRYTSASPTNCTSQASGNWNTAATWTNCRGSVPQAGDSATILSGHTVTLNVTTPTLADVTNGGTLTASGTNTLIVGGNFSNTGTVSLGSSNVDLYGNFTNNGGANFNGASDSGTWTFKGLAVQNINSTDILTVFPKLTLNNSFGIALNASVSVKTLLTLTSGYISTGSNIVTVMAACPASTARTSGFVEGNLRLTYAGTTACTYYVGSGTTYAPMTLTPTVSASGTLTGTTTGAEHPEIATAGIDATKDVNRYWSLWTTGDTFSGNGYGLQFTFVSGDLDITATTGNFIVGKYANSTWSQPTVGTRTATSTQITGVTGSIASTTGFAVGEVGVVEAPCTSVANMTCVCDNFGRTTLNPSTIYGANWVVGNSSGTFGNPVIVSNALRLTDASTNVSTVATVPGQFPAAGNTVTVEFRHYAYGSTTNPGADGIALTLSDASITPAAGAYGGSLGYAQKTGINGFAGGWLGVGIDEWGNFANPTEGRVGSGTGSGFVAESVTLRGSGSGSGNAATNYPFLVSTGNLGTSAIDDRGSSTPSHGYLYRITVDALSYTWNGSTGTKATKVKVERDTGTGYATLNNLDLPDIYSYNTGQADVPANWKLSFTGASGSNTNIHEIKYLKICSTFYTPPAGFGILVDNLSPTTCTTAANGKPTITVSARDSSGNVITNYSNAVNLYARKSSPSGSVSTTATWTSDANNHGTWDSANKRYTFSPLDLGVAKFYLTDGTAEDIYITVGENGGTLSTTLSTPVQYRGTAFTVTTPDALGTGVVAGRNHLMALTRSNGCGTDATYSGSKNLDGWYTGTANHPAGADAPQICAPNAGATCLPATGSCYTLSIAPPSLSSSSNYLPALSFTSGVGNFCLVTSDVGNYSVNLRDDSDTANPVIGSSEPLVVRPFAVVVSNVKQGAINNPATSDGSGTPMVAGTAFEATVGGYLWKSTGSSTLGEGDTDGNGVPDSGATSAQLTSGGIAKHYADTVALAANTSVPGNFAPTAPPATQGVLTGGSVAVTGGSGTLSTLNYNEVGSFTLKATPAVNYLNAGVDLASRVAICANPAGTAQTSWVGRFRPDHFGVSGTLVTRSDLQATEAQSTPFTYMGEPMKLTLLVTPYTASDGITYNYAASGYTKLDAVTLGTGTNWFNTGCASDTQCMGLGAVNGGTTGLSGRLAVDTGVASPSSSWDAVTGIGTFTVHVRLGRAAAPDGPYDSLDLGVLPHDSDGVQVPAAASTDTHKVDLDATTAATLSSNPDGTLERRRIVVAARERFGRLRLVPTQCSPRAACSVKLVAEYWDGTQLTPHAIDSLAPLAAANVSVSNLASVTSVGTFSSGWGSILLTPTGSFGTATVCAYLDTSAGKFVSTTPACATATAAARSYLQGNWAGTTAYDYDPNAQIVFGGARAPSGFFYRRENF